MKRVVIVLAMILVFAMCAFAAQYHSVPVGHEAYRIIEVAEIRGTIPPQTDVKPYNVNVVRNLLNEIIASESFSASEKTQVKRVLAELDSKYGKSASFDFIVGRSDSSNVLDARIGAMAYVNGDMFDFKSYDLNFKLNLDKIDIKARPLTDLLINCDGFYMDVFSAEDGSERLTVLPDPTNRFYLGIEAFPEISLSFKDEFVTARFGTVKRDWGIGYNNLALSGSARAFEAIELTIKPADWFTYSVATGSLGFVSLTKVNDVDWPSEDMENKKGSYNNNLSIHKLELGPFSGIKIGIWESVVWRKRFELSYLNPLAIYMFAQNALGDYDNVLAGFDFSFTAKGIGKFYASFAFDELNNAKLVSNPRNIIALQVGAKFNPKIFDFSELTVQATYVTAFFGSHYEKDDAMLFANMPYTTAYVNKGQNIGYPVNPDTIELLTGFKTSFGEGWTVDVVIKDQMRSAQYSYKTTGTDILTPMNYDAYYAGEYQSRDFFKNIWNNVLDVEAGVEKKLSSFPVSFSFGLSGIWDRTRSFTPLIPEGQTYNPGYVSLDEDWVNTFTVSAKFGGKIYY